MNRISYVLLFLLSIFSGIEQVIGQEVKVLTEDYKMPRDSCGIVIFDLVDYLKGIGFCEGKGNLKEEKGEVDLVRKKLLVNGKNFSQGYSFILELKYSDLIGELERYYGEFGIIEVGFPTEAKAEEVFDKANRASEHSALNIPILIAPFRCVKIGKSVLFVYATNIAYEKYMHALKNWKPKLES